MAIIPLPAHWTDLDRALFLLDGAEQSLVDEFQATANPNAIALLSDYALRLDELRKEMAEELRAAVEETLTTSEVDGLRTLWSDDDRRPGGTIARDTILRLLDIIERERGDA